MLLYVPAIIDGNINATTKKPALPYGDAGFFMRISNRTLPLNPPFAVQNSNEFNPALVVPCRSQAGCFHIKIRAEKYLFTTCPHYFG